LRRKKEAMFDEGTKKILLLLQRWPLGWAFFVKIKRSHGASLAIGLFFRYPQTFLTGFSSGT